MLNRIKMEFNKPYKQFFAYYILIYIWLAFVIKQKDTNLFERLHRIKVLLFHQNDRNCEHIITGMYLYKNSFKNLNFTQEVNAMIKRFGSILHSIKCHLFYTIKKRILNIYNYL